MYRSFFAVLMVMFVLTLVTGCKQEPQRKDPVAKDFVLDAVDGSIIRMSDYKGKVVLLEFMATWCPPCKLSLPDLMDLNNMFKDKDFALLSISVDEPRTRLKSFVDEYEIPYVMLIDDKNVNGQYGVMTLPTTFLIDKQGNIALKHIGYMPEFADIFGNEIEELLK
jgi:peroxiredoxin